MRSEVLLVGLVLVMVGLGARPAQESRCPDDMVPTGKGTCIDRYEWPNRRGEKPLLGISGIAEDADLTAGRVMDIERLCASVGKRVCTLNEWTKACEGPDGTQFPFGEELPPYNPAEQDGLCNYDKWYIPARNEQLIAARNSKEMKRLDQSEPAGNRDTCRSASGAFDMVGNAEEWVRCPKAGRYGWCLMGRFWSEPWSCQRRITAHSPKWHYFNSGGRCCTDSR